MSLGGLTQRTVGGSGSSSGLASGWDAGKARRILPTSNFRSFSDFYPFYLSEHSHPTNRRLHVIGTGLVLLTIAFAILSGRAAALFLVPFVGYGFAWVGHFVFEKNKPATFKHPLYSLMGDFRMFYDVVTGKLDF